MSLTAVKTRYPLTSITWLYRRLRCRPIEVKFFLKLPTDKVLVFKRSQAQVYIFVKFIWNVLCLYMCRTIKIVISNWPRTRKFSQLLQAGKTVAFGFFHHVHALVTLYVQFLCSYWSKFDRWLWVHEENWCSILNLVYFDSWRWESLCQLVMFLTVFLHCCYQESSVIHG